MKKEQEREKMMQKQKTLLDFADLSDDDDTKENMSSEENESEAKSDCIISSFEQKRMKEERYSHLQSSLTSLDQKFAELYSCPQIIDLAAKHQQNSQSYDQNIIGRNLKLRDLKLECIQLSKQCKDIESNFHSNNKLKTPQNEQTAMTMLGRIDIHGLKSANKQTKVRLKSKG